MKFFKLTIALLFVLAFGQTAWAQATLNNLPAEVRAEDATITEFGHATMMEEVKIVTDSLTRRTDTLREVTHIDWDTPSGTAKLRNAERGSNPTGSGFIPKATAVGSTSTTTTTTTPPSTPKDSMCCLAQWRVCPTRIATTSTTSSSVAM